MAKTNHHICLQAQYEAHSSYHHNLCHQSLQTDGQSDGQTDGRWTRGYCISTAWASSSKAELKMCFFMGNIISACISNVMQITIFHTGPIPSLWLLLLAYHSFIIDAFWTTRFTITQIEDQIEMCIDLKMSASPMAPIWRSERKHDHTSYTPDMNM